MYLFPNFVYGKAFSIPDEKDGCESITSCIERLSEISKNGPKVVSYPYTDGDILVSRLLDFKGKVVAELLPLLNHENETAVSIATSVLNHTELIEDEHFPFLYEMVEKGNPFLVLAIGNIKSDRALKEVVKRYLLEPYEKPSYHSAYRPAADALSRQGKRAIPYILKIIKCEYGCDQDTYAALAHTVKSMEGEVPVVTENAFIDQALDEDSTFEFVTKALDAINIIGVFDKQLESKLLRLRELKPSLEKPVGETIVKIGSKETGAVFAQKFKAVNSFEPVLKLIRSVDGQGNAEKKFLDFMKSKSKKLSLMIDVNLRAWSEYDEDEIKGYELEVRREQGGRDIRFKLIENNEGLRADEYPWEFLQSDFQRGVLYEVAETGLPAYSVGPEVVSLLSSNNHLIRLDAIQALGSIGFDKSIDKITPFLTDSLDVRINKEAVIALGKLKAKSALPDLKKVFQSHWYPPVREVAKEAIDKINGTYVEEKVDDDLLVLIPIYFEYPYCDGSIEHSHNHKDSHVHTEEEAYDLVDLHEPLKDKSMRALSFNKEHVRYIDSLSVNGHEEINDLVEFYDAKTTQVLGGGMVEVSWTVVEQPSAALAVGDGWLLGTNHGKYGGELVYYTDGGNIETVLNDNVEGIYKFGNKYIVVAGVSHRGGSRGDVYEVFRQGGNWRSKVWRVLPDAPFHSGFVASGELFINTYAGSLLLSESGGLRMAECEE